MMSDDEIPDDPLAGPRPDPAALSDMTQLRGAYIRLAQERDELEQRIDAGLRYRLDTAEADLIKSRRRIKDLKNKLTAEKAARLAAKERENKARRQLRAMTTSTSWRITAPLRKIFHKFKR